jgi:hypothetical protein
MNKILLTFVLIYGSFSSLQAFTAENIQEQIIEKLLSVRAINTTEISDICSQNICPSEYFADEGLSYQLVSGANTDLQPMSSSKKMETYSIMIHNIEGYTFHIADYYGYWGNSRVVTCLDGGLRGLQGISDNGILMVQSTDVKWHKNYFEHKYPAAKVYSYSNKQVFELK